MKKSIVLLSLMLISIAYVTAQKNPNIVYAVSKSPVTINLPEDRCVYGGTVFNVTYKGTQISNTIKNAFEYACKLD